METLVLNVSYIPVKRVSWEHAIQMWYKGLVEIVEEYEDRTIRSVTMEIRMPSVVRYLRWQKPKNKAVRFSRENIYTRDRGRCQYCNCKVKRPEMTLDHVNPRSKGGKTTWDNVVVCCWPCNDKKRDRTPEQASMRLLSKPVQPKALPEGFRITIRYEKGMPSGWKNYIVDTLASMHYWNDELETDK